MPLPDYYKLLGVARGETPENIKKAYRRLARRYHPDVSKEKNAERRMKEINEAYEVLSDPQKRQEYDNMLDVAVHGHEDGGHFRGRDAHEFHGFHPFTRSQEDFPFPGQDEDIPHGFEGFGNLDDLFERIFRGGNQAFRERVGGDDTRAEIELDIEDAFTGAQRQIELHLPYRDVAGRRRSRLRRLDVRIPPGIYEGKIIRLAGQGIPGEGGDTGDLLLEVRFRAHPIMRAIKRDIHMALPLAPWEAALGAVLTVTLPTGSVKVRLPKGVEQGRQLRVPGRGIPGNPPGDLILEAAIVLPPADTPAAERAYEAFARATAFSPRG